MSFQKRVLIQNRGISATHPILTLLGSNEAVVCSVASREGNSSFDYSLILPPHVIAPSMSDETAITVISQSQNHKQSAWGWDLALKHGITEEDIREVFSLIDIPNPRKIRLSRATREAQQNVEPQTKSC
ncbi:MAG: hypothetical protein ACE5OZ_20305 [Candidatus Heimdallarchaeota archaeon]